MKIIRFELKQHTPIIHFQAKVDGATLRASEVKPKLDKFLFRKFSFFDVDAEGNSTIKPEYVDCIKKIGNKKFSFDYALSFIARDNVITEIDSRHRNSPMYFGNMGDNPNDHKDFVYARGGVAGKIRVKNGLLKEHLEKCLEEFFWLHNFGTRQSKGYGSFTLINGSNDCDLYKYKFTVPLDNRNDWLQNCKRVLENIDWFYKSLRSGINLKQGSRTNLYFKSALFLYLYNKNKQWDKRTIKSHFLNRELMDQEDYHDFDDDLQIEVEDSITEGDHKDYKDLLGLSSVEKWGSYRAMIKKSDIHGFISRYKSPIQFKPCINERNACVYFDAFVEDNEWYKKYVESEFEVSFQRQNERFSTNLILPIANDFNVLDFLHYTFNEIDPNIWIGNQWNSRDYQAKKVRRILIRIYDELYEQISE